ncbi:hypothetical protein A2U01_0063105, partial [Trifolium medium]|nr:hypothetical protein [Trifolium medium]
RKKTKSGEGTHAPDKEKKDQAGGSYEEKKDRKRKDKKKDKLQHTEETRDKSESKKAKKHKKKKSKSFEDKNIPTPSIHPSVETQPKEKEDKPPSNILPESRPEVQEPPIDDAHQQG